MRIGLSIRFKFPTARAFDLVGFSWSPLFELVLSLRAVTDPKRTPMHLPWERRCRELPDDLLRELHDLAVFNGYQPGVFEIGFGGRSLSFHDELAALEAVDDAMFARELAFGFSDGCMLGPDDDDRSILLDLTNDPEQRRRIEDVYDDPARVRARYVTFFERYWEAAFADEWDRLSPKIEAEVSDGARALVTGGAPSLVAELLPEGRWDEATTSIIVEKSWDADCDVAERGGMSFVPTWYGWPAVMIGLAEPFQVTIIHPLREMRHPQVPTASDAEVAAGFSAIGDQTRLQIARLVAENPRSTKELAELLSLSDSAISRHLKILGGAGLVEGRRDGYFVLYSLASSRLDTLGQALRATLGLAVGRGATNPALPVSIPSAEYAVQARGG